MQNRRNKEELAGDVLLWESRTTNDDINKSNRE